MVMDSQCCIQAEKNMVKEINKVLADHICNLPPSIERSMLIQKLCTIHPDFIKLISLLN
jgi:hypothetical protein